MGRYTYSVDGRNVFGSSPDARLDIGSFCSIATGVVFMCSGQHLVDSPTSFPIHQFVLRRPNPTRNGGRPSGIEVGNDVWIGRNAIILPGVKVHHGAVIGAGAIVTKDVAPYAIVSGVPAKVRRYRFSDNIIGQLIAIRWWDWDDEKIEREADALTGPIEAFAERHSSLVS